MTNFLLILFGISTSALAQIMLEKIEAFSIFEGLQFFCLFHSGRFVLRIFFWDLCICSQDIQFEQNQPGDDDRHYASGCLGGSIDIQRASFHETNFWHCAWIYFYIFDCQIKWKN